MASLIRYDARFNSLCDQIKQLTSTIENTQEVLELTLDDERNRIARLELVLNMAGISFGACSAIGGFFGMNVVNGVENLPGIFAIVTGSDSHSARALSLLRLCTLLCMMTCHDDVCVCASGDRFVNPPHGLALRHMLAPVQIRLAPAACGCRPGCRRAQERSRQPRPRLSRAAQPAAVA
jgi:hypothetical protein